MTKPDIGPKSKSILIQVAFKAAVDLRVAGQNKADSLFTDTRHLYDGLIALHDELEAGDEPKSRGGGSYRRGGGGGGTGGGSKVSVDYFGNGQPIEFWDNRETKTGRQPDFRSVDKFNTDKGYNNIGLWLTTPDGDPNEETVDLLTEAGVLGGEPKVAAGPTPSTSTAPDEAPF